MILVASIEVVYANEVITSNETVIVNGKITDYRDDINENDMKVIIPINEQYNKLVDYPNGYSVLYPNDMNVDVHLSPIQTVVFNSNTRLEIYYDDLRGTGANASDYIYYSNSFIRNKADHTKIYEKNMVHNNNRIHILKWMRRKLSRVKNDKNYYLCAEIVKNNEEVYTLFFKSSEELNDVQCMTIIKSFEYIEKKGKPYMALNQTKKSVESSEPAEADELDVSMSTYKNKFNPQWNEATQQFFYDYFVNSKQLTWGIFNPLSDDYLEYFDGLENTLNFKFPFTLLYHILPSKDTLDDIQERLIAAQQNDRYVELSLQTSRISEEEGNLVYDILDGEYDGFLNQYAQMLKNFGQPIMFRLNNEMNGDWCDYSAFHTSKDTLIYKALYQYVYNVFEMNQVKNVIWVWNPHDKSFPNFKWNHSLMFYPEDDDMVDIIGLTGYNTGTYYPGETWRGFNEIYDSLYEEYDAYFEKPFMITEFSSSCYGGDKNAWIEEMFTNITKYEKIEAAIWWNGWDYDNNGIPSRIYRLDETRDMLNIFSDRLQKFK